MLILDFKKKIIITKKRKVKNDINKVMIFLFNLEVITHLYAVILTWKH